MALTLMQPRVQFDADEDLADGEDGGEGHVVTLHPLRLQHGEVEVLEQLGLGDADIFGPHH